jgi:hypothetical protein
MLKQSTRYKNSSKQVAQLVQDELKLVALVVVHGRSPIDDAVCIAPGGPFVKDNANCASSKGLGENCEPARTTTRLLNFPIRNTEAQKKYRIDLQPI